MNASVRKKRFSKMSKSKSIFIVKSKKWYGRFWPPERKKIKVMQALVDYMSPEIEQKTKKAVNNYLIYGIEPEWMKTK